MKRSASFNTLAAALVLASSPGCQSTDASPGGNYYDAGLQDPWYYGAYDDDINVVVPPPERPTAPPRPTHPIAPVPPPRPMPLPYIPRTPTPRAR